MSIVVFDFFSGSTSFPCFREQKSPLFLASRNLRSYHTLTIFPAAIPQHVHLNDSSPSSAKPKGDESG